MPMFDKVRVLLSFIPFVGFSSAFAVDESRLWIPTNFERQYLNLKNAAEAAESLDRCVEVVRGTIDLGRSTKELPIFRIQCRQENGRTYNEMVNGISFETLTTRVVDESQLTPEEQARRQQKLENAKKAFLNRCLAELESKTQLFINKKLLSQTHEPITFSLEQAEFVFDFDAEDINGVALEYTSTCKVAEGIDLKVTSRN